MKRSSRSTSSAAASSTSSFRRSRSSPSRRSRWSTRWSTSKGTRKVAEAYLKYLYTPEAQEIIAKHYYRPRNPQVAAKYKARFPNVKLFTIDRNFGGWKQAQANHFNDGGAVRPDLRSRQALGAPSNLNMETDMRFLLLAGASAARARDARLRPGRRGSVDHRAERSRRSTRWSSDGRGGRRRRRPRPTGDPVLDRLNALEARIQQLEARNAELEQQAELNEGRLAIGRDPRRQGGAVHLGARPSPSRPATSPSSRAA